MGESKKLFARAKNPWESASKTT